jgi:anti-sigma factor RsiW
MNNQSISEADLHAYIDGQLSPQARAEVETHLSLNAEDAARVAAYQAQSAALTQALNPVLEEPLPERLMRGHTPVRGQKPRHFPAALVASIAFAAGILAGAGGLRLLEYRSEFVSQDMGAHDVSSKDVGANVARAAIEAHRVFIPEVLHPVEVRGDDSSLLHWLSKRLGYPMALPDLNEQGFSLMGGRLLAGPQGPAALFMFETASGSRLTLYCGRMKPVADSAFRFTQTDGVGTVYWTSDNIGFAVTAPLDRSTLQKLAELFFEAMEQEPKRPT